jgi:phenylacetate-CoA ligase
MENPLLSVIAPCFNEEGNIREFALRVLKVFETGSIQGELILVNDGSKDRTGEFADALAKEFVPRIQVKHHSKNRGLEGGWRTGCEVARGEFVCIIDSDLQYQPEDILRLFDLMKSDPHIIAQGVRDTIGKLSGYRYVMSRALNLLLNSAFSMKLKDNKSGFFVTRRENLSAILTHEYPYRYYQILIMVAAHCRGIEIKELEVPFLRRQAGASFIPRIPFRVISGCLIDLGRGLIEFRLRRQKSLE